MKLAFGKDIECINNLREILTYAKMDEVILMKIKKKPRQEKDECVYNNEKRNNIRPG